MCARGMGFIMNEVRIPASALQGYLTYKKTHPPRTPYRRPMSRVLGGSYGAGCFLIRKVFHLGVNSEADVNRHHQNYVRGGSWLFFILNEVHIPFFNQNTIPLR